MRTTRRRMQIIFQDPFASLNPLKSVRQILSQLYRVHKITSGGEISSKVEELLEDMGLSPAHLCARARKRVVLKGDIPSPIDILKGCRFHSRYPEAFDRCLVEDPSLIDSDAKHKLACHLVNG